MLYLCICLTLIQEPVLPSWGHQLSQLIFEEDFTTENMVLMSLEQGRGTGMKIVADGVGLDFNIRIYSIPEARVPEHTDQEVSDKEQIWVIGEIRKLHTPEPPGFEAWSLQFPEASSSSQTGKIPHLFFSDSMQRIIFSSAEDLIQAIDREIIHGWVCPSIVDQVLKSQTRGKTIRVYTQNQKFYWWAGTEMHHQGSSLPYTLKRLTQRVDRFQGVPEYRHHVLNRFIASLFLKDRSHTQIHGDLKGHTFLQPGADPINADLDPTYIDNRWLNLTRRTMPPVPAHLLELTVY